MRPTRQVSSPTLNHESVSPLVSCFASLNDDFLHLAPRGHLDLVVIIRDLGLLTPLRAAVIPSSSASRAGQTPRNTAWESLLYDRRLLDERDVSAMKTPGLRGAVLPRQASSQALMGVIGQKSVLEGAKTSPRQARRWCITPPHHRYFGQCVRVGTGPSQPQATVASPNTTRRAGQGWPNGRGKRERNHPSLSAWWTEE